MRARGTAALLVVLCSNLCCHLLVPYSPTVWETSPDGHAWTIRKEATPSLVSFDSVRAELWAGTWKAETTPGEARLDDFAASLGACL
jgi:hypothetical protein